MYLLYRVLTAVGVLLLVPYYALRGWRRGEAALRERLGFLPQPLTVLLESSPAAGAIWIHAVSVGEVLAAQPLVEGLKSRFPGRHIFVSTTTETGRRLARERLPSADAVFYFPLDCGASVRRVLRAIHPTIVIVMETEIWPNFLHEAKRGGIPVIFVNARISERSFERYKRWRFLVGEFYVRVLQDAELFLAQTQEDAERLSAMGALEERLEVIGNLKYDSDPPAGGPFGVWFEDQVRQQERWPVLIAGSVVAGEEEAVLAAYDIVQRRWRRALLVLAPRKPDRFDAATEIGSAGGWNVVRRSRLDLGAILDETADVLVLDSIGELSGLYLFADAVFVGGSLVPSGGHNILEPAWFSKVPVFGFSMENFRDMADQFLAAKAGIQVTSGSELGKVWIQLIEGHAFRERMGRSAHELTERSRGATERALGRIAAVLGAT